jgi:hypothetical protein
MKNGFCLSKPQMNQNANLENLTSPKNDKAKETEIILQTQLTRTFARKRQVNFENLLNQLRRKPKPRNKANQNQS